MKYELAAHGPFLPAPVGSTGYPPRISWDLLTTGKANLIYMGEGSYERQALTNAYFNLLKNLHNIQAWEDAFISAGTVADIYVHDRHGERYRLMGVEVDPGDETGILVLRHLGKRARQGDIRIDVHETYGYLFPTIVYRPTRVSGPQPVVDDAYQVKVGGGFGGVRGHDEAKAKWIAEANETWNKREKLTAAQLDEEWKHEWSRRKHAEKFGGRSIGDVRNPPRKRRNPLPRRRNVCEDRVPVSSWSASAWYAPWHISSRSEGRWWYIENTTTRKLIRLHSYEAAERRIAQLNQNLSDEDVFYAFYHGLGAEGKKLSTTGERLDGNWMGGDGILIKRNDRIVERDLGSKKAQNVQKKFRAWLKKQARPTPRVDEDYSWTIG